MKSLLFYDLETSGLNKSFDQIFQFAAIRTDDQLREKERYSINVKLRPDIIPSPYAAITHRIPIDIMKEGITELDAVRQIHALLNTPGTISLGYNTLGFDDEFLRFSFYRNFLSPYSHQYANRCSRMDLLPVAVLYYLYKPNVISWPVIDSRSSFKLEHLSTLNNLAIGRAHDAMVDVEATVELARRFYQEKSMWDFVLGYFSKDTDKDRTIKLPSVFDTAAGMHLFGLMTSPKFGHDNLYQSPVLYLGDSIPYKNQSLWLRIDQSDIQNLTEDTIPEITRIVRKRFGEPPVILPPLDRFMGRLEDDRKKLVHDNVSFLQKEKDLFYKTITYHCEFRYPEVKDVDVDGALYLKGFPTKEEERLCTEFLRESGDRGEVALACFSEGPLKEQARRILYRNQPSESFDSLKSRYQAYMDKINPSDDSDVMRDYRDDVRLTPRMALKQIMEIRAGLTLDPEQGAILDSLEQYIIDTYPACMSRIKAEE